MELTAPGPSGLDMLRGAPSMIRDPLGFLGQQWRAHGDVAQFPIPNPPTKTSAKGPVRDNGPRP